jgi:hypothetical protein
VFLYPRHYMEVSGLLHAPTAFPSKVHLDKEVLVAPRIALDMVTNKKFLAWRDPNPDHSIRS